MQPNALRPIAHPGQSDTLVHFCGRARPATAPEVAFLSPEERLGNIVAEEEFRAFPTFGGPSRVVCFSESDPLGVEALLKRSHFQGWGVVVRRDWVWSRGGGPVWYVRDNIWEQLKNVVDNEIRSWMVRTSPGDADWFHEREWRVPCPSGVLKLSAVDIVALVVSDPAWEPRGVPDVGMYPPGGLAIVEVTPPIATEVPRWFWTGTEIVELPPLESRIEYVHPL